jgi:hypothetical protein
MRPTRGFVALLEAFRTTGGTAPGLANLIHTGQVFGFEWCASLWIPMFQFAADDLALKPGAQRVRAELPPLWSGWQLAFTREV